MSLGTMKAALEQYRLELEEHIPARLQDESVPRKLREAMLYSLNAGGKRIRPVLCLAWAELFGAQRQGVLGFAAALEFIHTYSLVHDDLPAMDNDSVRRGQPANHVQYGEATAILAGDGLLSEAVHMMLDTEAVQPFRLVRATKEVVQAAGSRGMIGGQALDLSLTGAEDIHLEQLKTMHQMKTGAMIKASCLSGAILAGAEDAELERVAEYGSNLGLAFQVADDILDIEGDQEQLGKPVGSDVWQQKSTYPGLLGLEESRQLGNQLVHRAVQALSPYSGKQAGFLQDLAYYVMQRTQ